MWKSFGLSLSIKGGGLLAQMISRNQCWLMHLMCSDKAAVTVFLLLPGALMDISGLSLHIEGGGTRGHVIFMTHYCIWICTGNVLDGAVQQVAALDDWFYIWRREFLLKKDCYANITVLSLFIISFFSLTNVPQEDRFNEFITCHWVSLKCLTRHSAQKYKNMLPGTH